MSVPRSSPEALLALADGDLKRFALADLPPDPPRRKRSRKPTASDILPGDHLCTDLANARRLLKAHETSARYLKAWGRWYLWDGARWAPDASDKIFLMASGLSALIDAEVTQCQNDDVRKALRSWATASESLARIRAAVDLLRVRAGIAATPDAFDRNHWVINVQNGTINLKTGALLQHSRADMITRLAPVVFDPGATCPTWERFLEDILPSPELRAFVQRAVGYCLTGETTEHVLFIAHGTGRNGKTVFLETVKAILGDYAQTASASTFTNSRDSDKIPNDLASTVNVRCLTVSETQEGRKLDEPMVKSVTGGDEVRARFMRAEWFTFKPIFKPWLATNHRPQVVGTDLGIWRRLRLIPFSVTIAEDRVDKHLTEKLKAEYPGILAWMVRGCLAWQADGLGTAPEVASATAAYRAEQDRIGDFLGECCVELAGAFVSRADLRAAYERWSTAAGEKPLSARAFNERIRERFHDDQLTSGARTKGWRGVGLTDFTNRNGTAFSG